jgi:hypothetical protein
VPGCYACGLLTGGLAQRLILESFRNTFGVPLS